MKSKTRIDNCYQIKIPDENREIQNFITEYANDIGKLKTLALKHIIQSFKKRYDKNKNINKINTVQEAKNESIV